MSTDALAEILLILRKHTNISTKVTLETTRNGTIWTCISLKEVTGIQSILPKSSGNTSRKLLQGNKKHKNCPSREIRDKTRLEAYLSRKADSASDQSTIGPDPHTIAQHPPSIGQDPSTITQDPSTPQHTDPMAKRRIVIPGRSRHKLGASCTGIVEKGEVWSQEVEESDLKQIGEESPIPQLDGNSSFNLKQLCRAEDPTVAVPTLAAV